MSRLLRLLENATQGPFRVVEGGPPYHSSYVESENPGDDDPRIARMYNRWDAELFTHLANALPLFAELESAVLGLSPHLASSDEIRDQVNNTEGAFVPSSQDIAEARVLEALWRLREFDDEKSTESAT